MFGRCFLLICLALTAWLPSDATAQGRFSPALQVGDRVVTNYQIDQRTRFLTLLGAPGNVQEIAREQLINEAVQLSAAEAAELEVSPEQIEAGMAEFAARGNLQVDQVLTILSRAGIQAETFRDFILAGVVWREVVRERFGDAARASIPETQVKRTLAQTGTQGGLRVLVSEVLLPTSTPETALASRERAAQIAQLTDADAFAAAARQYSVANSAARGGELDWVALDTLPETVRPFVSALAPGQATRPIELENAVGVFFLRDSEQVAAGTEETLLIDYALYVVDGDRTKAASIAAEVDVCDDLYGVALGQPEDRLVRDAVPPSALATDLRNALAILDENEATTSITRGGSATVLMLCERRPASESTVDLDIVGTRLLNARLGATAQHYLTELRASTIVIDLTN